VRRAEIQGVWGVGCGGAHLDLHQVARAVEEDASLPVRELCPESVPAQGPWTLGMMLEKSRASVCLWRVKLKDLNNFKVQEKPLIRRDSRSARQRHSGVRVSYPLNLLGFAPCDIGLAEPGSAVSGLSLRHSPLQYVIGVDASSRQGLRRANDDLLIVAPMRKQLALSTAPGSPPRYPG